LDFSLDKNLNAEEVFNEYRHLYVHITLSYWLNTAVYMHIHTNYPSSECRNIDKFHFVLSYKLITTICGV